MILQADLDYVMHATGSNIEELMDRSRTESWNIFGRRIYFYAPTFLPFTAQSGRHDVKLFPSISITGGTCSLKCQHCSGKMLETMIPVDSPSSLIALCKRIERNGGVGCLISGGCRPDGTVPLENFVEAIKRTKSQTSLTVVVHTGVLKEDMATRLADAQIDAALIDVIGSDETIREIYRLNATVHDYEESIRALHDAGVRFVPHILVGLHYGKLKGELQALRLVSSYDPAALIFIALIPIKGTPMENIPPPHPLDVTKVMISARKLMPRIPHALGCARPTAAHRRETDVLAIKAGINAIAFPSDEAISTAKSLGLETSFSPMCCSQTYIDVCAIRPQPLV